MMRPSTHRRVVGWEPGSPAVLILGCGHRKPAARRFAKTTRCYECGRNPYDKRESGRRGAMLRMPTPKRTTPEQRREQNRTATAALRARRVQDGLCPGCGGALDRDGKNCRACLDVVLIKREVRRSAA